MQKSNLFIFILVFTILLSIGAIYLGRKLIWTFPWLQTHKSYVTISLFLFIVVQALGPLLYRLRPTEEGLNPFVLQWLTYVSLGFIASLFFYFLTAEFLLYLFKFFSQNSTPQEIESLERRVFFGISLFTLGSAFWGMKTALQGPVIEEVKVPLKGLPSDFDGFRIVQISDLHVGPTIDRTYAENVVAKAMGLKPDLIVLTGDLIDGFPEILRTHVAPLQNLKAPHGVFYVTGNHEYYWGAEAWCKEFENLGFTVLMNENRVITKGGASICIGGVTDLKAHQFNSNHRSDAIKAFRGIPNEMTKILLAHQPASYKMAIESGTHLMLSGHTHGGQFFPWSLIVTLVQKFNRGLYFYENLWVYTNRGTGYWGPPQRLGVPSEITHLHLIRS